MAGLNSNTQVTGLDIEDALLGDLYQAVFELNYTECQSLQQSYKAQLNNVKLNREKMFEKAGLRKNAASQNELNFSETISGRDKIDNWIVV